MELHIKITGALFILLGCLHAGFPNYFRWKKELEQLSLINRQMMYVHTFFIALTVCLMGVGCLYAAHDIATARLGKYLSLGLFIFWGLRFLFQFFYYSPLLWKGKGFETAMHVFFGLLWGYVSVVFLLAFLGSPVK